MKRRGFAAFHQGLRRLINCGFYQELHRLIYRGISSGPALLRKLSVEPPIFMILISRKQRGISFLSNTSGASCVIHANCDCLLCSGISGPKMTMPP